MPSRTAPRLPGGSESLKELLRSRPSILEEGFRVLDLDLKAGQAGTIDAIGVDRGGRLSIVVLDGGEPDAALVRLLDARIWSDDQRDLLAKVYGGQGVDLARPVRGLILAPAFTHDFLRRLSLVKCDITAYLAREVVLQDGPRMVVERAASLFGMARPASAVHGGSGSEPQPPRERPFWPDGVLPSDDDRDAVEAVAAETVPVAPAAALVSDPAAEDAAWPGSLDELPPWERTGDAAGATDGDDLLAPPPEATGPAGVFEMLTSEEMEEFDRFERQRRERDRRST